MTQPGSPKKRQDSSAVLIRNACILGGSLVLIIAFVFCGPSSTRPLGSSRPQKSVSTRQSPTTNPRLRYLPRTVPARRADSAANSSRDAEEQFGDRTGSSDKLNTPPDDLSPTKPPPETRPFRRKLSYASAALDLQVLADGRSSDRSIIARTNFAFPTYRFPDYEYDPVTKRITKFNEDFEFTGPFTIQTVYGPAVSKHSPSRYGRGTTEQDQRDGNTTLGFHEHCHRLDYVEFLDSHPLPEFAIRPGITVQQYETLQQAYERKLAAYMKAMSDYSDQRTDEVGRKKSEFVSEIVSD